MWYSFEKPYRITIVEKNIQFEYQVPTYKTIICCCIIYRVGLKLPECIKPEELKNNTIDYCIDIYQNHAKTFLYNSKGTFIHILPGRKYTVGTSYITI